MYLALLVAFVTTLAPWLRGAWDLWAQTGLALLILAAMTAWLAARVIQGAVPFPNARHTAFLAALAAVIIASAAASPVRGDSLPGLLPWGLALWILWAVPLIPEERRVVVENSWIAGGWGLFLLAFYQRFFQHSPNPEASLLNTNVFSAYLLMLLPLAYARGRRVLFVALLWALWWTQSLSAWLAVSGLLLLATFRRGGLSLGVSLIVAFVCLIGLHEKISTPSFLDRLFWWQTAGGMAQARPFLGFGPGTFATVFPFYRPWTGQLSSQFAHQYPLQTAAELGLPFAVAWLAWILKRWTETDGWASRALFLVMFQSFGEYALIIPSHAWMLAYLLVAEYPMEPVWVAIPGRLKLPCLLALAGLSASAFHLAAAPWKCQTGWIQAGEAAGGGDLPRAQALAFEARRRFPYDPGPSLVLARLEELAYGADRRSSRLWKAAEYLEDALREDPYHGRGRSDLETLYGRLGRADLARLTHDRAGLR